MTCVFVAVALTVLFLAPAGCRRQSVARTSERDSAKREPLAAAAASPRLPEDPAAGKRAEAQWREHMLDEEHERQLGFDRQRLKEHQAMVRLIASARARYDRARTEAAVAKVRTDLPRRIAEMRRRVVEIDRWRVNSRLLSDYAALESSLTDTYAEAKIAAIRGDARALEKVRAGFDQRMKNIADWLTEAKREEREGTD